MTKSNRILVLLAVFGLSGITMFAQETGVVINGVTWATRNVDMPGTFTDNPEDFGMFYQWNCKIGWSNTDPLVSSEDGAVWEYHESDTWELANDPCPAGWHMPTSEDFQTLCNTTNVTYIWETGGVIGGRFTDIANGTSIFLPAAGNRANHNGMLSMVGKGGYYWSSTHTSGDNGALALRFDNAAFNNHVVGSGSIGLGFCVRCVKDVGVGINEILKDTETATPIGYFDVLGKRLSEEPKQGFYIIMYDNGKTKKVMK